MRILGKGKTAQAIKDLYSDATMYDDNDIESYNKDSDELTVVSPGIPPFNMLVTGTKNLISEYDLFTNTMPFSIWISGTNGKTTTTSMMQHILEEQDSQYGGNIGVPLANMDKDKNIWILETSSFTLHYTNKAKPNIYVLLPISDDHASWHGSFEEYEKSKLDPISRLSEGEIVILPSKYKDYKTNGFKICYDTTEDLANSFNINTSLINFDEPYLMDAVLALAISRILYDKVDYAKINTFIQDPHKLEKIYDENNVLWINDSKATNIDATIQALKTYKKNEILLILGGDDKGANLNPLFNTLKECKITLYCIGRNANKLESLALSNDILSKKCDTLENAIKIIKKDIKDKKNKIVLLSPAAASFDQFESYAHRGNLYKSLILKAI
jgi:UDP-N-acetylmuramoylalanine--D-glutamate ligase